MNKTLKIVATALAAITATAALAQSAAPPIPIGPNGEAYWFGPGPSAHALKFGSSTMNTNGGFDRAWFSWDSAFGFTAYANVAAVPIADPFTFQVNINAPTYITVLPYVYVDGYFGLSAAVQGWGTTANLNLGFSRFYILHNAPVFVRFIGFTNATLQPPFSAGIYGYNTIAMTYQATVRPFLQSTGAGGAIYTQFNFGPTSGNGLAYLDPTMATNFFAQIDIARTATVYWNNPAGPYKANGLVIVSNF